MNDKSDILEKRSNLSAAQRELLKQRMRGQAKQTAPASSIPRRPADGPIPLSFAQQRMWVLDQLEPGSTAYNIPYAVRMTGTLQAEVLERSLNEVIRRHEALRTTFANVEGEGVQVIAPASTVQIGQVNICHLPEEEREAEVNRLAVEISQIPFDLAQGPLLRATVIQQEEQVYTLVLIIHHIIGDGWSLGVLVREMAAIYAAFLEGKPSPLPELPIQYADFTHWQRQCLQGEVLEKQLSYWRGQLGGDLPIVQVPTDRPRPAVQTYRGANYEFVISKPVREGLSALSQQEKASLYMTLLTAFQTLIFRYTGLEDIPVGSPIANRNRGELEGLIGFFVNTLVFRSDLAGNPTFRELLGRVRQVTLDAFAHQDVPFEKLVEELQPERNMSFSPLFQVMFALQNAPVPTMELPGLTLSPSVIDSGNAKFDLFLYLVESEQGLTGTFEYNTDLFDRSTMERMAAHLQTLLEQIVDNPDQPITELVYMTDAERHQLLVEWNGTEAEFPQDACVHRLFEEQAERTPDAVALVFDGRQMTFAELNQRANQMARYLQKGGVGPERLVGISMQRSPEMIVGLLGILKAGGAYVPIDPGYPEDRIAYMLEDAHVPILLTQQKLVDRLPVNDARVICLDTDWAEIAQESADNLDVELAADALMYVLYTSGSTGKPKGVEGTHRMMVNRFAWMWKTYPFTASDVCSQKTSLNFGDSIWEIWGPLLRGIQLVIIPDIVVKDMVQFVAALRAHQVTRIVLVPSLLRALLDMYDDLQQELPELNFWVCSGEALPVDLTKRFQRAMPQARLLNLYGSTEVAADVTFYDTSEIGENYKNIPIGKPIDNVQIYILDPQLRLVPVGVPGELCVGGVALARGYFNRPDLTAERFLPNPFSADPDARLFRMGDAVRYLPDGNIEFLGRVDNQVKIRGYRIEVGEIENTLSLHEAVRSVVVVARDDAQGYKQLVAYVVPDPEQSPTIGELRTYLQSKLPDYMMPAVFMLLDALPLTPSGKVNRLALPKPDGSQAQTEKEYVAPRTSMESELAEIWKSVLKIEQVGVHDNFFELGGHSLLATQIMSRVSKVFEVDLPLRTLFEAPVLEQLANCIEESKQAGVGLQVPPILTVPRDTYMPMSFAQERLWFFEQLEPGTSTYNIPEVVRVEGHIDMNAFERTIRELVRRHETMRTTFVTVEGRPMQFIDPDFQFEIPVIDLTHVPKSERAAYAEALTLELYKKPFDLEKGPLFSVTLLRLAEQTHIFVLNMHHIITDGWSMGRLYQEVIALYLAYTSGQEHSDLPELPVQYADFAIWQRQWMQGEVLEGQLDYWRTKLSGKLPVLQLPTDRPRPAMQTFPGMSYPFVLPKKLSAELNALCQREGLTLFMVLLAAYNVLLSRYAGQADILVGAPIANRNRNEIEGLIGFFVNTLVLRTELQGELSVRELLEQVRVTTLDAYANQDVPFEKLVEELQPERNPSYSTLIQAMFALQNTPGSALQIQGLTVELPEVKLTRLGVEKGFIDFDLFFSMVDNEQGLTGQIDFNTDLFDLSTVQRMLGHFQTLLEQFVQNLEQPVSHLSLLTEAEQQQLATWNETTVALPEEVWSVPQLFERQVERTPDATAVVFEGRSLSYRELNERANRLAHHLRANGVGQDVCVGICVERSLELAVGIVGILKAGGAYVALDPSYPQERLAFMLADTQVSVIVTLAHLRDTLPAHEAVVVALDADWAHIAQQSAVNPEQVGNGSHLAYLLYTSGSTGVPKGVAMPHRPLVNMLHWQLDAFSLSGAAVTMQFASLNFDVSFQEIFSTFCSGGTLVIPTEEVRIDAKRLLQYLAAHAVERVFLPFVVFHHLAEVAAIEEAVRLPLREIITAGEQLQITPSIVNWLQTLEGCTVHNQYGPSESHVVTVYMLTGAPETWPQLPPIGRPIANAELYVLDEQLQPVPIGVPGELYIGGEVLARGYWNRANLTAERFIPHPFTQSEGARLYKTGDSVRWLADGDLEYMGRIDNQVKIRGFRVELGEIEAVLSQHPAIRENAVVAREDVPGEKRLVAYIVAESAEGVGEASGEVMAIGELRRFLLEKLPEYMVPSVFVALDELPLTPNGKVDRRGLPVPEFSRTDLKNGFQAPRTAVEQVLAGIWEDVLHLEQVSVHDNFFEMGGHSLVATQVMSRVSKAFQVDVPLRKLFEAPTVSELAETVEQLRQNGGGLQGPQLRPAPQDTVRPLSFAQERLWFFEQLQGGTATYNIPLAVRLSGDLDVSVLERCFHEIMRRHEALRTTFANVDGQPSQVVSETVQVQMNVREVAGRTVSEREAEMVAILKADAQLPFDLMYGPLMRTTLVKISEQEHVLLTTMHHIISDGWSIGVLLRELAALYEAYAQGMPSPLPELEIQYADFATGQRDWLQGDVLEAQLAYWTEQLGGELPLLQLPTDRPRPAVQTYRGAQFTFVLPPELSQALVKLSRREGATLYMVLLGAFKTLLYRYSGQADLLVGSPIANRDQNEIEALIGFFVNTLVMRTQLSGAQSFRDLLAQVSKTALDAYAHQHLPFEKLVEVLQPERNLSYSPIFQVMFALQNAPLGALELPNLTLEPVMVDNETSMFDLMLSMTETTDGLQGFVQYNADLFDATTIERMTRHFHTLLEGIIANPNEALSRLPLLTDAERHQQLVEWNDTATDLPEHLRLDAWLAAQSARTPERVAVRFGSAEMTYRELDQQSNRLARHLQKQGVGPDVPVAISVERSFEMIVGVVAILKAGGAYVPIDPAYPTERIAYQLEDSQALVLLTQQQVLEDLPPLDQKVVCLDVDGDAWAAESAEPMFAQGTADQLAYIIYTSGSTGKPKGVMIEHRAICNSLVQLIRGYEITEESRILQFASFSFDVSVFEIFAPLVTGATICLAQREELMQGSRLVELMQEMAITTTFLPPAMLALMPEAELPALRTISAGGESFTGELVERWARGRRFLNGYGPTETTIISSLPECLPGEPVTLGRPQGNYTYYLLDEHLQPVPVGVPGELHIGGISLARGYLNRPELTAEKFIRHPFSTEPGARLYKSGDLARYLSDGRVEYLGRIDNQVKIRGFRIELGEIESVLKQHPAVRETVVVIREDQPGDKRLVAYLSKATTGTGDTLEDGPLSGELRQYLLKKLPEYMVPSVFVLLEVLPLSPNGKVDRHQLPVPQAIRMEAADSFVAPRTVVEEVIAGIWANVLQMEQISVHDNFFDLGGHSLLATQLISRIGKAFHIELPLRKLFVAPTVAALADSVEQLRQHGQHLQAPPLLPTQRGEISPLSFAQQRMWFFEQWHVGTATNNIPLAVRLSGPLDVSVLERSFHEIVRRHEVLRTTFATINGVPSQVIAPTLQVPLHVLQVTGATAAEQEAEIEKLAKADVQQPFDLIQGPLIRTTLLRIHEQEHVLVATLHHIISDGWSFGVLLQELAVIYEAYVQGLPSPLPELPIQYAEFAAWQAEWLQGEVLESQLSYWKDQLGGDLPVLQLPTDRPRPAVQTFRGASLWFTLPKEMTRALVDLGRREGATLYMVLLTAFKTLLYRYSGQTDIIVGSPIANRDRSELEGLIGFFVNTLVLRTQVAGEQKFRELLAQVNETALDAYAHQHLPFEKLVEALQPKRDLSYSPIFQVMFALQNAPMGKLELPNLTLEPVEVDNETSMFDLTLSMKETTDGLEGFVQYNADLFDASTIERMTHHFHTLLEGILANPNQALAHLPLLTEAERQQQLVEWNDTATAGPAHLRLDEWFTTQAERTPDRVAVRLGSNELTYRELNRQANRLARHLQKQGVGPDVLVALAVERSFEQIIGVLGILKAGGAYVPIDPAYPADRIAYLLEDSQAPVLLTQAHVLAKLPAIKQQVACLDADGNAWAQESAEQVPTDGTPDHLAYIIYTSGSTGKPKGVMIEHRAICNSIAQLVRRYEIREESRVLQFASCSFDASVLEIFTALVTGATLCLVQREDVMQGERLLEQMRELEITMTLLPPAMLAVLPKAELPALQTLSTGGDSVTEEIVERWATGRRFLNSYGPTEASIVSSIDECVPGERLTIGRPQGNYTHYVLDANLQPVPVGVPGELHIGGGSLARGYLHRPELTAEKFIPHPFSAEPGARLYKSGDLARYLPDGRVQHLGRVDTQVKVRGFRIELGEIESVLRQLPAVGEAAVIVREETPGDKRLIAYLVAASDHSEISVSDIRRHVQEQLPEYMVPSAFVVLEEMPLNTNQKVDRRALAVLSSVEATRETAYVAPRDALEWELVRMWEELLGTHPVGIRDHFFNVGGHSLLAMRLTAQLQKRYGQQVPLASLFQHATVEELARLLRQQGGAAYSLQRDSSLVELQAGGTKRPLFLIHAVGGHVISYFPMVRALGADQPIYGLQAVGLEGECEPFTRVEEMAAHYVAEMRTVQEQGPYLLGGWSMGGVVAYEMAQQLQQQGETVELLAFFDSWVPHDAMFQSVDEGTDRVVAFARDLLGTIGAEVPTDVQEKFLRQEPADALRFLLEQGRLLGFLPPDMTEAQIERLFRVHHANSQAFQQYQPAPSTHPILLLKAGEETSLDDADLSHGWSKYTDALEVVEVEGDHFTLLKPPHVQEVAEALRRRLAQAKSVSMQN